jgi:hypothetical protein
MSRSTCTEAAVGHWHEILTSLAGVNLALLDGKPHGCPICGDGVDRFTFDNKEGRGTWLCRKCPAAPGKGAGGGDGMDLLQAVTGWDFKKAAAEIERHLRLPSRLPSNGHRPRPHPPAATPPPALPATPQGPIELLRLPGPAEDVVRLDPDGPIVRLRDGEFICAAVYRYSPSQQTQRLQPVAGGPKRFSVRSKVNGRPTWGAGPDPWPAWRQSEAIAAAKANPDNWVLEGEGEKVAEIAREGGLVCITQPGHAHNPEQIQPRYEALKAAGVAGVVFLADHDAKGHERALKAQGAANTVGLPLVVLPASDVWPTVPKGGSIDDAPGTPAERAAAIAKGVGLIKPGEWAGVLADWGARLGVRQTQDADDESPRLTRSELLAIALQSLEDGDEDAYAEVQAELMGRFRMTASQVQAALFRLLTQRQAADQRKPGPGVVDITAVRQLDHLVPGFVADREQTVAHAPRGTGKTLAALAIARAVVTRTPLLDRGEAPRKGRVLYLATDSGCESMHVQMQELGLLELPEFQHGHPEQRFFIRGHSPDQAVTAWEATIPEILWLLRFVQDKSIDLVVIDSAKACMSLTDAEYTDNKAVGALLTLFQRVICPHVSVLWLHHDGRETGHNAGAKAWAEIPVMVHRIERVEEPKNRSAFDGPAPPKGARKWICMKSRIAGDERDFTYSLTANGELQVTADVEIVGNCEAAVVDVLRQALLLGTNSLPTGELTEEVMRKHGRSSKTVRNTIGLMRRRRVVVSAGRGRWALAPSLAERASRA